MARKLFVGNLAPDVTAETLERTFSPFGTVRNAEIITDTGTLTPKGFAFVEMGSEDEAAQATIALNGHDLGGRPLIVRDARPKKGVWGIGGVNRKS
jgi:RNA recognition motif-containing protein